MKKFSIKLDEIMNYLSAAMTSMLRLFVLLGFIGVATFSWFFLGAVTAAWVSLLSGVFTYFVLFWSTRSGFSDTGQPSGGIPAAPDPEKIKACGYADEEDFHKKCAEGRAKEAKREQRRKTLAEMCNIFGFILMTVFVVLVIFAFPLLRVQIVALLAVSMGVWFLARAMYVVLPSYKFGQMYRGQDKSRTHGDGRPLRGRVRPGPCPVIPTQEYVEVFSEQPFNRTFDVTTQIPTDRLDVEGKALMLDGTLRVSLDMGFDGSIFDDEELLVRPGLTQSYIETGFTNVIKSVLAALMNLHPAEKLSNNLEVIGLIARLHVSVPYAWRPHRGLDRKDYLAFYAGGKLSDETEVNAKTAEDHRRQAKARIDNVFLRSELENARGARVHNLKITQFIPPKTVEQAQEALRGSQLAGQGLAAKWQPLAVVAAVAANAITRGIVKGLQGEEVSPGPVATGGGSSAGGHGH